ncbi:MAG: molybdenum ABC transporter ATP-binding protein [Myxococcota bacterium]
MSSLIQVHLEQPGLLLDLQIEWDVQTLVLFGASGAGKTSLLRVLLGLEPCATARVQLGGHWLEDESQGLHVPAHRRRLGWVPQAPTLFPDRDVEANIRFGAMGPAAETESAIEQAIEVLELDPLRSRSITRLSGGEQSRVALARAIACSPRALLLDEPLAALDVALRRRILPYLIRIREELGLPIVHITHDPDEAILLGDEIVVLDAGRVIAQGPPRETLWSQAVHSLDGELEVENLIEVQAENAAESATTPQTTRARTSGGVELALPWPVEAGEQLSLALRPEDVLIALARLDGISARNCLEGEVAEIETYGDHVLVHTLVHASVHSSVKDLRIASKITKGAATELELRPGRTVYLIIKSQALRRVR